MKSGILITLEFMQGFLIGRIKVYTLLEEKTLNILTLMSKK